MPQQPVTPNYANYPGMVPNGYVSMPNYVNVSSTPPLMQTALSPSRGTWSIQP